MACGDYTNLAQEAVSAGAAQDFITCPFVNSLGEWVWPLMVVGALFAGTFAATRSFVPPIILMLLLGPFMIIALPSAGVNILIIGALFVVPSVLFLLFLKLRYARR